MPTSKVDTVNVDKAISLALNEITEISNIFDVGLVEVKLESQEKAIWRITFHRQLGGTHDQIIFRVDTNKNTAEYVRY